MTGIGYTPEIKARVLERLKTEKLYRVSKEEGIAESTIRLWRHEAIGTQPVPANAIVKPTIEKPPPKSANILIYDIETLPNLGYFWDTYSDRAIPLDFILKPKSICTIAWKWYLQPETYVAVMDEAYNDKSPLEAFLAEWMKADYVVAHYSKFDKPFIAARLMANHMPSLPPVNDICTYKLAKAHFGRSLNGNKLDHLGTILGVGNKIKTNAELWVKCAANDKQALQEMADYNMQDVKLLEQVFTGMLPYVKSKLNLNLTSDSVTQLCKQCGSDSLEHRGFEYTASAMRHRFLCKACGSYSSFPGKKQ